jgi:8-hydroxy-5-deazaflavin:NADPH oxidoreductase
MKIAILGTGMVGNAIGSKLIALGHEVRMGSRTTSNEKAVEWTKANGANASHDTFDNAAGFAEIIFNCTSGGVSMEVLKSVETKKLEGKILVDVANPLDASKGMPPVLIPGYCNTTSLGEEIQKAFPGLKVVKSLNTMNCSLMVNPSLVPGEHDVFMSGNDTAAKAKVKELLISFGWKSPIDLGDISTARGTEMLLPIWLRLWGVYQSPNFNFRIVR